MFMKRYNFERTNQGKRCLGRTPYETFIEGIQKYGVLVYDATKNNLEKILQYKYFLAGGGCKRKS